MPARHSTWGHCLMRTLPGRTAASQAMRAGFELIQRTRLLRRHERIASACQTEATYVVQPTSTDARRHQDEAPSDLTKNSSRILRSLAFHYACIGRPRAAPTTEPACLQNRCAPSAASAATDPFHIPGKPACRLSLASSTELEHRGEDRRPDLNQSQMGCLCTRLPLSMLRKMCSDYTHGRVPYSASQGENGDCIDTGPPQVRAAVHTPDSNDAQDSRTS